MKTFSILSIIFCVNYEKMLNAFTFEISEMSSTNNSSRSVAESNINLSVNEYLEGARSPNSKKLENQVINLFNSTMESLNKTESTNSYKKLNDTSIDELPARLSKFFMCCLNCEGTLP